MSQNKDMPEHENISDILEELKRSYEIQDSDKVSNEVESNSSQMSEDELKAKLRMQFMSEGENVSSDVEEDGYFIDEDFLEEARLEEPVVAEEAEALEMPKVEDEVEPEFEEYEAVTYSADIEDDIPDLIEDDDNITFDQLEDIEDDDIVLTHLDIEDDDITFDQLEATEEDDGIVLTKLEIEEDNAEDFFGEEDVLTVSEEIESNEEDIAYLHLDREMLEDEDIESLVAEVEELPQVPVAEEWTGPKIPVTLFPEQKTDMPNTENATQDIVQTIDEAVVSVPIETDVQEETEDIIAQNLLEDDATIELDGADISLLMQFGCQEEILNRCSEQTIQKIADQEVLESVSVRSQEKFADNCAKAKILARQEAYQRSRGALLVKLALSALLSLVLFIYEGFPQIFGLEFPGILNREEYFISYVFLGLQTAVLCGVIVYRQIWDGMKKLFSRSPDEYSVISVLAASTVIYDVSILFVDGTIPFTFHFLLALSVLIAVLLDYQMLLSEKRCFEFYFSDVILGKAEQDNSGTKRFTLCKSEGSSSSAEKMYAGGLDASNEVFFPIEVDGSIGFFSALKTRSKGNRILAFLIIPAIAFSLIAGIVTLVFLEEIWLSFAALTVSLFMCMPVIWTVARWLPFAKLSETFASDGYAFAGEGSAERYADCGMTIFSDMHLFAKCDPSSVNLLLYDATSKEVLLGCLNAVYSKIGGPMGSTFKAAQNTKFEQCNINRIARSGIEAVVGGNYSVLLGTESFMLRYGISFPKVTLKDQSDEIFTLCVSINGRVSARIAVKYTVNEVFEMLLSRLAEDGINCAIETFDPMINAQTLTRIREGAQVPVNIVHLGVDDYVLKQNEKREKILFSTSGEGLGVVAEGSRFNLAVALSASKYLRRLHLYTDLLCAGISALGALITLLIVALGVIDGFSQLFILLYWILSAVGFITVIYKFFPRRDRYSLDRYKQEQIEKQRTHTKG